MDWTGASQSRVGSEAQGPIMDNLVRIQTERSKVGCEVGCVAGVRRLSPEGKR